MYPVSQSKLGRKLRLPVEVLIDHSEKIDRTRVLTAEAQFVAKMAAVLDRPDTLPGEKDRREMWELINSSRGFDFQAVAGIRLRGGREGKRQTDLLDHISDLLGETADLSKQVRAMLGLNRVRAHQATR